MAMIITHLGKMNPPPSSPIAKRVSSRVFKGMTTLEKEVIEALLALSLHDEEVGETTYTKRAKRS